MPEYKLIYFNARGRGELTRWIFAYGKIPYVDERIEFQDWPRIKPTLLTKKVPLLVVDGKTLPESMAMARYVAGEVGLIPEDHFLAAKVDAGLDDFVDIQNSEIRKINRSPASTEEKIRMMKEDLYPNTLAPLLKRLDKQLEGRQWFVGDKVTLLDFHSANIFSGYTDKIPNLFDGVPNVQKHTERVLNLPGIKEWVAKRPKTLV